MNLKKYLNPEYTLHLWYILGTIISILVIGGVNITADFLFLKVDHETVALLIFFVTQGIFFILFLLRMGIVIVQMFQRSRTVLSALVFISITLMTIIAIYVLPYLFFVYVMGIREL